MLRSAGSRRRAVPASASVSSWRDRFPEGITFAWLALGFVLCRYLTDTHLPDLGLTQLAHDYEASVNNVAPYIELPLCAVLWSFLLVRTRQQRPDRLELRPRFVCGAAYGLGIGVALLLKHSLEQAALGGRLGEDVPNDIPLVATLLAMAVYLLVRRRRPVDGGPLP